MNNIIVLDTAKEQLGYITKSSDSSEIMAVYGHKNKLTNQWYCGQTKYFKDPNKGRWKNGTGYLRKKKSGEYQHPKFAPAILKYSWNNFDHYILGYYTRSDIDAGEKLWISLKDSYNNGYNASLGGQRTKEFSDDTRKKLSQKLKGKMAGSKNPMYGKPGTRLGIKMDDKTKEKIKKALIGNPKLHIMRGFESPCAIKVVALDKYTLEPLKVFNTAKDAGKLFGARDGAHISNCCNGTRKSAFGFKWVRYTSDIIIKNLLSDEEFLSRQKREPLSTEQKIVFLNENKEFKNISDASKYAGVSKNIIRDICKGRRYDYNNLRWAYINNKRKEHHKPKDHLKVFIKDKDGNITYFSNIEMLAIHLHGSKKYIAKLLSKKKYTYKGYLIGYASN